MTVLATDIGYGHTKYAYNDILAKFPTVLAFLYQRKTNSLGENMSINYEGNDYLVGEMALESTNTIQSSANKFLLKYSPIFIYEIFRRLGFPVIDVVYVSQAISEFKTNFSEIQKVCSKFTINGREFSQKVLVLPQGLGIWYDCDKPSDALIIDIGFNTVDVLRIKNSKPQPENSLSILGTGVVIMANLFSELLSEELKFQFNAVESNRILMDGGKFRYNRQNFDFSDDVMRLKKVYTEKLLTDVLTNPHILKTIGNVENLIIAGGGAYFIDKKIQEDQNIYIPDKPEYSNVLGFIKHSQLQ